MSCPSTNFCLSIDSTGKVFSYGHGVWTRSGRLDHTTEGGNIQVVCESRTWCLATVGSPELYRYNGTRWAVVHTDTATGSVGGTHDIVTLTCASTSFCMVAGHGGVVSILNGKSWSKPEQVDPDLHGFPPTFFSSSCPTSRFCVVGDDRGRVLTYNGKAWSGPTTITGLKNSVDSISCVSSTYCLAASYLDYSIHRYNGQKWKPLHLPKKLVRPQSLSCVSVSYCLTLSADSSRSSIYNGSHFEKVRTIKPSLEGPEPDPGAATCVSARFCLALVSEGAVVSTGAAWSSTARFDPAGGGLSNVTCTAGPFCLAVDTAGNTKTYKAGKWTAAGPIGSVPVTVSCTSATFCVAAGYDGGQIFDGSSWSHGGQPDDTLIDVSCVSSTFCLASGYSGETYAYDGSTWTRTPAARLDLDNFEIDGISCVAPSRCTIVASSDDGVARSVSEVFNGSRWGKPVKVSAGFDLAPTCVSRTFCLTAGDSGVYEYTGTSWSSPTKLGFDAYYVSCGSTTFCVATDTNKVAIFNGTTWSKPSSIGPRATSLEDLSCTSDDFCLASDHFLDVYALS